MYEVLVRYGLDKESVLETLWLYLPNFASAFTVILMSVLFYLITAQLFEATLSRTPMQPSLIKITVRSLYRSIVVIIAIIIVLSKLGINVTAAIAGVGVVGLAVGFAAQTTLANIFSGFGIFMDDLFRRGHWVRIAEHYGEVIDISLRTTKIKTLDNTCISIPNSLITSSPIVNYSEQGILRITTRVLIGYGAPVEKARTVLLKAIKGIKGVLKDPAPHVVVDHLAESGVSLYVRIWVAEPGFEQKYYYLLTETCKQALDKAKIKIPFPQRDIHIIKENKRVQKAKSAKSLLVESK